MIRVSGLRPISLLNGSFKIILKILANRLGPLLDGLVDQAQSGFIRGYNIHESVATAYELIFQEQAFPREGFSSKIRL